MSDTDIRHMTHALSLGARGMGRVWPNPSVGCVIVKGGVVVGRGRTGDGGTPHAETIALAQAASKANGATVYVTLEPCSHQGRTPPCADALVAAGVAKAVIATGDPDCKVNGAGITRLRKAGIAVETGVLEDAAQQTHAGFFKRVTSGLPFLTLKLASSLDGRIATASSESKWITGPDARRHVHLMRSRHDAVMVGGGTVRADDPALTVRDIGIARQPIRVVLSAKLDLPTDGALAHTAKDVPVWLCHGADAEKKTLGKWQVLGAKTIACNLNDAGQVDPTDAMKKLAEAGLTRVFCEGGGALGASLIGADLVDELACFSAGIAIGADGQPMLGSFGLKKLAGAPRFSLTSQQTVGEDTLQIWRRI